MPRAGTKPQASAYAPSTVSTVMKGIRLLLFFEGHCVADLETQLLRLTARDFQNPRRGSDGWDNVRGERLCIPRDVNDAPIVANENHIERDVGVFHPHRDFLLFVEQENHTLVASKIPAEHETLFALGVGIRNLDVQKRGPIRRLYLKA